jgi:hypothetical protein
MHIWASIAYISILTLLGVFSLVAAFDVQSLNEATKQILIAVGTTLLATAALSIPFEVLTRAHGRRALSDLLEKALRQSHDLYGNAAMEGIAGIFPQRDDSELYKKIVKAKRLVILQNYEATLAQLAPAIEKMLEADGKLQFFYLNPDSEFAAARERQLAGLRSFKAMIEDNLNILTQFHRRFGSDCVSIREYSELSPVQMFIVDKEYYFAIFWAEAYARNTVHFLISNALSPSYKRVESHYKFYLANSKEVSRPEERLGEITRDLAKSKMTMPA